MEEQEERKEGELWLVYKMKIKNKIKRNIEIWKYSCNDHA